MLPGFNCGITFKIVCPLKFNLKIIKTILKNVHIDNMCIETRFAGQSLLNIQNKNSYFYF
jgi:hypothetical protein